MSHFNYEEVTIGQTYHTIFNLDEVTVKEYAECLGLRFSRNMKVPNSIFAIYRPWNCTIGNAARGTIHLKQKNEIFLKPEVGKCFDVEVKITDKYIKKGRRYLIFETSFTCENKLYCKETTTYLWAFAS